MRLRLNLLLSFLVATIAFMLGAECGKPFYETIAYLNALFIQYQALGVIDAELYSANVANYTYFGPAVVTFALTGGFALMMTAYALCQFGCKWWYEHKRLAKSAEYDMGDPVGVAIIIATLIAAAFVCGVASNSASSPIIALCMMIAVLPSLFQFIDLLAPTREKSRTHRPDG
jgi:hypothetical protein